MGQNNLFLPFKKFGSSALTAAQVDPQQNLQIVQAHGDKYNPAFAKNMFFVSVAGITTSAGLATTYTGLCLSNPAASTKNLSIRRVSAFMDVATTAITTIGLIVGYSAAGVVTHTTPVTSLQPTFLGNATVPQGLTDSACTIVGTPVWNQFISTLVTTTEGGGTVDVEGSLIIPPGGYVAIGTSIASGSSGLWGSIEWEEIAITG